MLIKKVAPFAAVALAGALMLTGCTSTGTAAPAASATTSAGTVVSGVQQKLIDALGASQTKLEKDGYTETATDGTTKVLIAYDPSTKRTTTEQGGSATYVEGINGVAPQSIKGYLESQAVTVTEKDSVYTVTIASNADSKLTITVKDGVAVAIKSETKGGATWDGKLAYKLTDEAKKAIAGATPAATAPAPTETPAG